MFDNDNEETQQEASPQQQGDGLHHHEIHQDEGGGFHSVHTAPDGAQDHADHADLDEAKSKMDQDFGGTDDGGDSDAMNDGGDDDPDDIAGGYGRACS